MLPNEQTSAADLAPDTLVFEMYKLLTDENKEKVNLFVAALIEMRQTGASSPDLLRIN